MLLTALIILAVAVTLLTSGKASELRPGAPVPKAGEVHRMFAGIPQRGQTLGRPGAPVTLVEFGDLQCPSCAIFAQEALPGIVSGYVRTGRVRMVFEPLHFIGPDSLKAAQMALALGEQGHLWNFAELMYRNQGAENSAYVTNTYLEALASAIPTANVREAMRARRSPRVAAAIRAVSAQAGTLGLKATPSFLLGPTGAKARLFTPTSISKTSSFAQALDKELEQVGG